jgi:hypothetical protein
MNLHINRKAIPLIFSLLIFIVLSVGCTTPGPETINHAPIITSTPITSATVNQVYTYNVDATDPDGDTLIYSLTVSHTGMIINSWTGAISWTPSSAGDYDVTIEVFDNGSPVKSFSQSFTIHVEEAPPVNQAPNITSTPITSATVDQAYTYNVDATDPDGDTLTYSLTTDTEPTDMTINSTTGLINWTPASIGYYDVTVRVSDGSLSDTQSFTIHVEEESEPTNQAPNITSNPITSATVDQAYTYNVDATDPDGDTLTYSLTTTKPTGMTINSTTGLINWTPNSTGDYNVTVKVSDGDLIDTQSFTITVGDGEVTPRLKLTPSSQTVSQGNQTTIDVEVEDVTDLKGASVTLNFDAAKLEYSSSTAGSFIPNANLFASSTNGSVNLDIAGLGASSYHSGMGTGTIITVVFDTIDNGNTNITFGATTLKDKDNITISHTKSGCSVNIN